MKTYYVMLCLFCDKILSEDANYCCGEAGHGEYSYVNEDGERLIEVNEDNYEALDNMPKSGYSVLDDSLWGYDYD